MRLGKIQQDVMRFVDACHPRPAYIYNRLSGFNGYDEIQILRAVHGLVNRGILTRKGPMLYKVTENEDDHSR